MESNVQLRFLEGYPPVRIERERLRLLCVADWRPQKLTRPALCADIPGEWTCRC
jgi:hypothetical protein